MKFILTTNHNNIVLRSTHYNHTLVFIDKYTFTDHLSYNFGVRLFPESRPRIKPRHSHFYPKNTTTEVYTSRKIKNIFKRMFYNGVYGAYLMAVKEAIKL